jgi:hypothetical protein
MRASLSGVVWPIENMKGLRTSVPDSAMVSARFACCTSILVMVCMIFWLSVGKMKMPKTGCSSFALAEDFGPLKYQVRSWGNELACMVPLVKTGQCAVKVVMGILNFLGKDGLILDVLAIVA